MYFDSSSSLICEKCRVHTLLIKVPQYFTLAPYKSHTELPYKHSKLAKIAKIRAVVCEDQTDVDARASRILLSVFFSLPFYIVSTSDCAIQIVPREVYVSHYPYEHSKLAEIAKIRAVVCEDKITVKGMRGIAFEVWCFNFHCIVSTSDCAIPRKV